LISNLFFLNIHLLLFEVFLFIFYLFIKPLVAKVLLYKCNLSGQQGDRRPKSIAFFQEQQKPTTFIQTETHKRQPKIAQINLQ